jgi:hypothetical protein
MTRIEQAALELARLLKMGTVPEEAVGTPRELEWDYIITISSNKAAISAGAADRLAACLTELQDALKAGGHSIEP